MWQCIECELENPKTIDTCEKCSAHRPPSTLIGEQISQWVIEEELGEGGMAVVFQAKHVMLGSPVAIKILRADLMHKREVVERFRTEALAASHLQHDNVIQVHDFGSQKGVGVYMVLEFLNGRDLEVQLEEEIRPLAWTMHVAKQICSGLGAAHNAGIIHRDLKPSNIYLVPREGSDMPLAKILDFGIAKIQESQLFEVGQQNLTRTGTVLGTPYYLSPEQLRRRDKQELGPSVDIYAFGVILFQMLTGELPIEEPTLAEQMAAILTRKPPLVGELKPELSGTSLELLVHRLLAKKPDDRPGTIGEVWQELEKAAGALNDPSVDAALRQQWKETYKTPDLDEMVQPRSFMAQYGMTIALLFLLLVGAGGLSYVLLKDRSGTTKQPTRLAPLKKAALPGWLDLQNKGARAYKSGNYLEAIRLWRQSLAGLKKNAAGGTGSKARRALLQSLGIAAQKSNRNYAARHFYQQLSRSAKLTQQEKDALLSRIGGLNNNLANDIKAIKLIDEIVGNNIQAKNYKAAFKTLQKLTNFPDKSIPLPLEKAGDRLAALVPAQALRHYKKAYKLSLTKQDKKRIADKRNALQARVDGNRQALAKLLAPDAKLNRKARRAINDLFAKQPGDLAMHRATMARIGQLLRTNPNQATALLRTYRKTLKGLQRKPSWLWVQGFVGKGIPSDGQLKQWLATIRKEKGNLRQIARKRRAADRYLERAQMAKLLKARTEQLTTQKEVWTRLATVKGPLQAQATAALKRNEAQSERLQQAGQLWQKIKARHEADQLTQAEPDFKALLALVTQQPKWTAGFTKAHQEWQQKHARAAAHLTKGDESAQKNRWSSCKRRFDLYLRLYPKAHNKDAIKLKRCKCRCKLPAPFEPCNEQCKLPYN